MNLIFRTFAEKDLNGIIKTFNAAFCSMHFCDPMTPERWNWRYGPNRPNYNPMGYQVCEYKGKVVGGIMATLRTMKFKGVQYRVAGVDDVSTCPPLEKRGIARRLLENAIKFMEEKTVDLSILTADPKGHAQRLYDRLGYTHKTYFSLAAKVISIKNTITAFPILTPLALPLRFYGNLQSQRRRKIFKGDIKFEILGKNQDEFRQKLNKAYNSIFSFDDYSQGYWEWYFLGRPKSRESIVVAAKENGKIIAGGIISKQRVMVLNMKNVAPICVLNEFFVDKAYRSRGIGSYLLYQLERVAKQSGACVILLTFHSQDTRFRKFLKKLGYLILDRVDLQMIKPISERARELIKGIEGKEFIWKVPYEQKGF